MCVYKGVVCIYIKNKQTKTNNNRTKKLGVKISTDNEGWANCRAAMSTSKKCENLFSRK